MTDRKDSLGRKIPNYDRSAVNKRAAATVKETQGEDFHSRNGTDGGRARKRGYFGTLKDNGQTEKLKELSHQAVESRKAKAELRKHNEVEGVQDRD